MEDNREEFETTTNVSSHSKKAASIYPEATKGVGSSFTDNKTRTLARLAAAKPNKSNSLPILIIFIVGIVVGVLLGRTIFKAKPTVEEATEALFGEVVDDFSQQFEEPN